MKTQVIYAAAIMALLSLSSFAQDNNKRFGFEINGGISIATRTMDEMNLDPGPGFEGLFHYRVLPMAGIYAGWGWNKLSASSSFAGGDVCLEETGYVLGVQLTHAFGPSAASMYLRAGGLFNHYEMENAAGNITSDSGHGPGWQVAAGVNLPLGKNWSLTPGVKFSALSRNTDFEGTTYSLNHNYASLRVGILRKF